MDKVSVACDFSLNYLLGLRFNDSCALWGGLTQGGSALFVREPLE
jgi:hypothetical protein